MECCIRWPGLHHHTIERVWDELDSRVKEKQPTSAQHTWELLQDYWKSILYEAGWEKCEDCAKLSSRQRASTLKHLKYILISLTLFWLLHDSICVILTYSLLFYNVENNKYKETLECVGVSKFDWYCTYTLPFKSLRSLRNFIFFNLKAHLSVRLTSNWSETV